MDSDEKAPTLYSSEGRKLIDSHLLALATDHYTSVCTYMRQLCSSTLNEHSREVADFCELDEAVAAAANAAFGSTPSQTQQCALAQRIHDLSRVHECGDNLTYRSRVCLGDLRQAFSSYDHHAGRCACSSAPRDREHRSTL